MSKKPPKWLADDPNMIRSMRNEVARNARQARNAKYFETSYGINELTDKAVTSTTIGPRMRIGRAAVTRTEGALKKRTNYITMLAEDLSASGKVTAVIKGLPVVAAAADLAGRIRRARKEKKGQ